jgi:hypothetical protein
VRYIVVEVREQHAVLGEQLAQKDGGLVKPLKVRIESASPRVSLSLLLDHRRRLLNHEVIGLGNLCFEGEVRADVEWRIDVDEIDLASELGEKTRRDVTSCRPRSVGCATPSACRSRRG